MPPAPGLIDRLQNEGRAVDILMRLSNAKQAGVDASFDFHPNRHNRDESDEDTFHVVCILVDFNDNEADTHSFSREHFEEMLFSQGEYRTGSLRDYYRENSYNQINITGDVAGWYRMPNDYAYYVAGQNGFGEYPRNAQGLTRDALRAADADINYRDYDNGNNRVAEGVFIVHAGEGAEATGSDDMIWSHAWGVPRDLRLDNMSFASYAMEPENGRVGVFGHELGHSLFGLPDLYDTDYNSAGVGSWSMMSGGSWGGGGDRPVHFDAWCKARMGMIQPFPIIEDNTDIIMQPVQRTDDVYLVWRTGNLQSEYFLLENRQRIGFDESLPAGGLLIWHCDDNAENNTHPWWPGQGNLHNIVALEQADGDYDLEHNNNSGDGSDPFPGELWKTLFGDETSPDSRDYAGESTNITVTNIEQMEDFQMRLDIFVNNEPQKEIPSLFLLERIPEHHVYPHPDFPQDTTDEVSLLTAYLHWMGVEPIGHSDALPDNIFDYNIIVYLESWRDGEDPAEGLTQDEQYELSLFLETGGMLLMMGPDIATNIASDTLLWPYCHAILNGDGASRETGNLRTLTGNPESRIAGQNFVYRQRGVTDHFIDVIDPDQGAQGLFSDQSHNSRGVMFVGEPGYRIILQPFLLGGMVDWGGSKADLLETYFDYFRFEVTEVKDNTAAPIPGGMELTAAYPNPFNGALNIGWRQAPTDAWIDVFDATGRRVARLGIPAGSGNQSWKPMNIPSGQYILQPSAIGTRASRVTYLR